MSSVTHTSRQIAFTTCIYWLLRPFFLESRVFFSNTATVNEKGVVVMDFIPLWLVIHWFQIIIEITSGYFSYTADLDQTLHTFTETHSFQHGKRKSGYSISKKPWAEPDTLLMTELHSCHICLLTSFLFIKPFYCDSQKRKLCKYLVHKIIWNNTANEHMQRKKTQCSFHIKVL